MDKYKKYYGIFIFLAVVIVVAFVFYSLVITRWGKYNGIIADYNAKKEKLTELQNQSKIVQEKLDKIRNSINGVQKKIYSPVESDLGNETLFFTLYTDVIEMIHTNSVRIKSIDYEYNPKSDKFVEHGGKDAYFVWDVKLELVSNYTNLGKLVQDLYQYPYYIKIVNLEVKPFEKDKSVLISNLNLRLYAHTTPEEVQANATEPAYGQPANAQ
ncbi:MAG: hypothetical protein MJ231_00905 [bacterium]|nr:hypothetical protein [bacterium]